MRSSKLALATKQPGLPKTLSYKTKGGDMYIYLKFTVYMVSTLGCGDLGRHRPVGQSPTLSESPEASAVQRWISLSAPLTFPSVSVGP